MKTKISVSLWTWIFFAIIILAGFGKIAAIAFTALLLHELAHVIVILMYGRKIEGLKLYPFGGIIYGTDPLILFAEEEVAIAFAGPVWNLFCTGLGWLAMLQLPFWHQEITWWWQINLYMGLVNLLPFFPLDGGRIAATVAFKYYGYRKGINIVSYFTQIAMVIGVVFAIFIRHNVTDIPYYTAGVVLFFAALKERKAAPYILLRYLMKKDGRLKTKKCLPAKILACREESFLSDIVAEMKEDLYYIICVISSDGSSRFLGEKAVIDSLVEKGSKTLLRDVLQKDFTY